METLGVELLTDQDGKGDAAEAFYKIIETLKYDDGIAKEVEVSIVEDGETEGGVLERIVESLGITGGGRTGCVALEGNWGGQRRPRVEVGEGEHYWGLAAVIVFKDEHYYVVESKNGKAWMIDGECIWRWVGAWALPEGAKITMALYRCRFSGGGGMAAAWGWGREQGVQSQDEGKGGGREKQRV